MIEGNATYNQQLAGNAGSTITSVWNGPKKWEECSDAEKIERLREECRKWQKISAALLDRVCTLEGHQHAGNGEILIQLHAANRAQMQTGQSFDYLR
jgi:hypothetical protein